MHSIPQTPIYLSVLEVQDACGPEVAISLSPINTPLHSSKCMGTGPGGERAQDHTSYKLHAQHSLWGSDIMLQLIMTLELASSTSYVIMA